MIVKGRRVARVLYERGWTIAGMRDRNEVLVHPDRPGVSILVPVHGNPLKPTVLDKILHDAGITPEEFVKLV